MKWNEVATVYGHKFVSDSGEYEVEPEDLDMDEWSLWRIGSGMGELGSGSVSECKRMAENNMREILK